MVAIRQLIQKGDPMLRVQLPTETLHLLEETAKQRKRKLQDQFIKALAETFKNEKTFAPVFDKFLSEIKEIYQQ